MKTRKIATLFVAVGMLVLGDARVTTSESIDRTNDNLPALLEDTSFTRRYLNAHEFTIETVRRDQASKPWCVDAVGCQGGAFCVRSVIGLRVCDPDTFPTQVFTRDTEKAYIYLARHVGLFVSESFF